MRDPDAVLADATEGSPFSNSSDGEDWMSRWCDRCVHGDEKLIGTDKSCTIILIGLLAATPKEWTKVGPGEYVCSEFWRKPEPGDGDDLDPGPPPNDPGQLDIFAEFADQIIDASQPVVSR